MYDIVIIGAGPAGLFAAYKLVDSKLKLLVIEQGRDVDKRKCPMTTTHCLKCKPCNIMCGVGGAGGLSDGKLNLKPDIGGNLVEFTSNKKKAWQLVKEVDNFFLEHGVQNKLFTDTAKAEVLRQKAASTGIKFIPIPQRHVGSDKLPMVVKSIKNYLEDKGVRFALNTKVLRIITHDNKVEGVKVIRNAKTRVIKCNRIIACPGRSGADWFGDEARRLDIRTRHAPIDIGVRIEVQSIIMEPVTRINWDPKFHIYTDTYDDKIRTFCVCPNGFVTKEDYGAFIGVNGHSMIKKKSDNTNFGFMTNISLTEPVEDTSAYGRSIAMLATTIGGGKPILQRLGDLVKGSRSTWKRIRKSYVNPTLTDVTPGDISMALPHRLVTDIIEGLHKLDKVIPGVASNNTLLYAPELKFYSMRFLVNKKMETSLKGLYAAGDGAGLARGIVGAAATGILAAEGILSSK